MSPNISEAPFDPALLKPEHIVFDLVYNPLNTKLLQAAKALNCTTISGVEMFIEQGAAQFELWTGIQAPREYMHRTILDYFSSKKP